MIGLLMLRGNWILSELLKKNESYFVVLRTTILNSKQCVNLESLIPYYKP